MIHKKQLTNFGCVYASLSMALGNSEEYWWSKISGKKDGAHFHEVSRSLGKLKIDHNLVSLNLEFKDCWWMELLSNRFPILISSTMKRQGKRGRPVVDHHAFVVFNGKIYDPSNDFELDLNSHREYKSLKVEKIIILHKENKNFGKGLTNSI